MEWSDVRIFLAIAREGTLGAGARKLGLTQPTMGRRLKALEDAVGSRLFQRTANGFVLTDEGASVMAHAERMEDEAIAMERELAGQERELDGMLRISSSDWFGLHVLAPTLAEFSKTHPKIVIELITDARLYDLSRREADLVFRMVPFTTPDVISRKIMHVPYGLYVRKSGHMADAIITMDESLAQMADAVWIRKTYPKANIVMRSNNRDVQAALCASGVGMAVLPRPLADPMKALELIEDVTPPGRDMFMGFHRDLRRLPRLRALLEHLKAG